MSTIGTMNVKLKADAQGFQSGLGAASNSLGKFSANAGAHLLGLATTILSVRQIFHSTMETFNKLDALGDAAERLDISTEALSHLRFAATMTDVSVEALESGLGIFTKTLGKAALGLDASGDSVTDLGDDINQLEGTSSSAFTKIGLNAAQLVLLPKEEAFAKTVEALNRVENTYKRTALAAQIFGKGALSIAPMLKLSRDELEELANQLDKFGGTLTSQEAKVVSVVDQTMKVAGAKWDALKKQFVMGLVVIDHKLHEVFGGEDSILVKAVKADLASKVKPTQPGGTDEETAGFRTSKAWKDEKALGEEMKKVTDELNLQTAALNHGWSPEEITRRRLATRGGNGEELEGLKRAQDAWIQKKKAIDDVAESMAAWGQFAQQTLRTTMTPLEDFENQLSDLQFAFAEGWLDSTAFNRAAGQLGQGLIDKANLGQAKLPEGLTAGSSAAISATNQNIAQQQGNSIADRFERAIKRLQDQQKEDTRNSAELVKLFQQFLTPPNLLP